MNSCGPPYPSEDDHDEDSYEWRVREGQLARLQASGHEAPDGPDRARERPQELPGGEHDVDVDERLHETPASSGSDRFFASVVPDVSLGAVEAEGDDVGDDESGEGDGDEQVQV